MSVAAPAMLNPFTLLQEGSNLLHGTPMRYRGFLRKLGAGAKDIPKGTILAHIGVQAGGAREQIFQPAQADDLSSYGCLLYVALKHTPAVLVDAADKDRVTQYIIGEECIIENVDTSGASVGDYVYLADAQATDGSNWSLTAGTNEVVVGVVVSVSATVGKIYLAPQKLAAKVAHLAEVARIPDLWGDATAADSATYAEINAGALYDGGTIVYSMKGVTGGATSKPTGWSQSGTGAGTKFRIALDAAPTAGKSITFSYIIKPPAV